MIDLADRLAPRPVPGLYGSPVSPFSARVTLAARAKGIELAAAPLPAGGLRSDAFLSINPVAKIPVLVLDDGLALAESHVILEYLEDVHPRPALLPVDGEDRAHMRLVVSLTDRYFMAPVIRLFPHLDPGRRNDAACADELARWRAGLGFVEHALERPLTPTEAPLTLGDCVLAPSFHLGTRIAAMLGLPEDPIAAFPRLSALYAVYRRHPVIAPILAELTSQQAIKDEKAGLPSIARFH